MGASRNVASPFTNYIMLIIRGTSKKGPHFLSKFLLCITGLMPSQTVSPIHCEISGASGAAHLVTWALNCTTLSSTAYRIVRHPHKTRSSCQDVEAGLADVGFVRTDLIDRLVTNNVTKQLGMQDRSRKGNCNALPCVCCSCILSINVHVHMALGR